MILVTSLVKRKKLVHMSEDTTSVFISDHIAVHFDVFHFILYFAGVGPQLSDLMNEIGAVIPAKWRDVGVQLGIAPGVLDGIQNQNAGNAESAQKSFEQVFIKWRGQGSKTPYTWTQIIDILRRPAVGNNELADTLATKFLECDIGFS